MKMSIFLPGSDIGNMRIANINGGGPANRDPARHPNGHLPCMTIWEWELRRAVVRNTVVSHRKFRLQRRAGHWPHFRQHTLP